MSSSTGNGTLAATGTGTGAGAGGAGNLPAGVINPYKNVRVITHRKFISHLGIAFIDLRSTHKSSSWWSLVRPPRTVLRRVCGQFNYGTLNAILGPWKSGKSTLLKSLAGRANHEIDPEAHFFVNEDIPPRVVFLNKETHLNVMQSLTIEEVLEFSYRLRANKHNEKTGPDEPEPAAERLMFIRELIRRFELRHAQKLKLRDCSSEERVRAEIACALAAPAGDRPNLIFVDEPLHNMDVVSTENLIFILKRLCRHYAIAITFTVGQILDSDILTVFDKLYVLSRGGLCIYEGSVDHLALYLRECGVTIDSKLETPMERLMKIASKPNQVTLRLANQTQSTRTDVLHMAQKYGIEAANGIETPIARVSFRQIHHLFRRSTIHKYRTQWRMSAIYLALIVAFTAMLTTAFNRGMGAPHGCFNRTTNHSVARFITFEPADMAKIDRDLMRRLADRPIDLIRGQTLIDENVKFIFVIMSGLTLFYVIVSSRGLDDEIHITVNEHRNGWLNISSYFIVKNVIDLVPPAVTTFACGTVAFLLTAQTLEASRYFAFQYALLAAVICAQSLGFVIGVISVFNQRYTSMMILVSYVLLIAFAGYLIPLSYINDALKGIAHLTFTKLTYELALVSVYGLGRCRAEGNYRNSYVLDEFGIGYRDTFWRNSLVIVLHMLAYRLLFLAILVFKVNKQRYIKRPEVIADGDGDEIFGDDSDSFKNK